MSYLSMMEATLPPGFRFHPRDEELVCDYLSEKLHGTCASLIDVDLNKCEPWDLPDMARVGGKEWYFFNLRDRKYATGQRTNRATTSGYWKATGKDRHVRRGRVLVGMRKTLVFHEGRAPRGRKTDWVMHEFRVERSSHASRSCAQKNTEEDWVLCRVFYKSRVHSSSSSSKAIKMHSTAANDEDDGADDNTLRSFSSPSSLSPLMETFITFNNNGHTANAQTPTNRRSIFEGHRVHQQVPCFSNPVTMLPIKDHRIHANNFGGLLNDNTANNSELSYSGSDHLNQDLDRDKKVMREVLNQPAKLQGNNLKVGPHPCLGVEEGSTASASYLVGGNMGTYSSMW